MDKEQITLSFAFFSPTKFEFRFACEHGSCESLSNILYSSALLVLILLCFAFAFCLMYYITGFKYGPNCNGDGQTSVHLDSMDKSVSQENSQRSAAKYRRNIRKSVHGMDNDFSVIVDEVQGRLSRKFVTNPLPVQRSQIQSHSHADITNIGRRRQRNPNRFQKRVAPCSDAKDFLTKDANSPVILISSGKTDVRDGRSGQRNPNRDLTRATDMTPCTDARVFLPSNAHRQSSSSKTSEPFRRENQLIPGSLISRDNIQDRGGGRRHRNPNRFGTIATDLAPCTNAKDFLSSHANSPGSLISRDKTDVREEEPQEEYDLEYSSDDTGNERSQEEVDGDIQSDSDCINDPYVDSASLFSETSNVSDVETDAFPYDACNYEPTEGDDTEDNCLNADLEPGICVEDGVKKGGLTCRQPNTRKNENFQMRKKKIRSFSSAKRSGVTIVKGENIMIGSNNKLIAVEGCKCSMKLDAIKQTLDGLSAMVFECSMKSDAFKQTLDGLSAMVLECSMKSDALNQTFDRLSAMVFEWSTQPNCAQPVQAERGIFAVPCKYIQMVARAASKFQHYDACSCNMTSAEDLDEIASKYHTVEMPKTLMNPHTDPSSWNVQSGHCDHISGTETDTEVLICRR